MKRVIGMKHKEGVWINGVFVRVKFGVQRGRRIVLEIYGDDAAAVTIKKVPLDKSTSAGP